MKLTNQQKEKITEYLNNGNKNFTNDLGVSKRQFYYFKSKNYNNNDNNEIKQFDDNKSVMDNFEKSVYDVDEEINEVQNDNLQNDNLQNEKVILENVIDDNDNNDNLFEFELDDGLNLQDNKTILKPKNSIDVNSMDENYFKKLRNSLNPFNNVLKEKSDNFDDIPVITKSIDKNVDKKPKSKSSKNVKVNEEDNLIERRIVIMKIRLYLNNFESKLKSIIPNKDKYLEKLKDLKIDKLNQHLDLLRTELNSSDGLGLVKTIFNSATGLIETIGTKFMKLQINGYQQKLNDNPEIDGCLLQIYIENIHYFYQYQNPTNKLAFIMLGTLYQMHMTNKMNNKVNDEISNALNKDVSELNDKYKDL